MKAYLFPGQGAQFPGMAKDLFEAYAAARELFELADEILGFSITDVMFRGSEDDLKQTRVTQPAIFLHSSILSKMMGAAFQPDMVAGHSLGEFSALVTTSCIGFKDGLRLVSTRANAMQRACEARPSTMAAILGLEDELVEETCAHVEGIVVAANYNSPGQVVISGETDAVNTACEILKTKGAKRALPLQVGGAFHSPLMEPARVELEEAINNTAFVKPCCPVYQNVNAMPVDDPGQIRINLAKQLTAPVKWTQTMQNIISDGATEFIEVGPGKVLQGLVKKINRELLSSSAVV